MPVNHIDNLEFKPITAPGAQGARIVAPVGPFEGWDSHVMRVIELDAHGATPRHSHPWPHINYVLEGEGSLFVHGVENPVKAGSYAFVPSGELHQFQNLSDKPFRFICIVPKEGHQY